ncbi:hypothetical protein F3F96_06335 [Mariprofundus sp. NF]|uniref:hypothetical protein n=1 Tax=Mariprofundus sp. NF TaxID=2608716 RepID=UPI0015A08D11|nr:hypothetical protein [Mariprofundus sp. NF]NWF38749.1 hypothetical protein [Mariprofundus sp. NF]
MKLKWHLRTFLYPILLSGLLFIPVSAQSAEGDIEPGNQEVIAEVERQTGLGFDVLDRLLKESPDLFGNIKDTITAVKLVDMLFSAQDAEVLTELITREMDAYVDKFVGKILPGSMTSFFGAVKLYKDALEAIRDYIFIPSMEAAIYDRFKTARGGALDFRYASPDEAFDEATARGKYFPAKQKMHDELVKAKGYDPKHIGKKLEDALWKQIDAFWVQRLETQYQQELFKQEKEQIIHDAWAKMGPELKAIKAAAGKSNDIANFFLHVPDDLPKGWWFSPTGSWTSTAAARMNPKSTVWKQFFFISRDSGFVKQGDTSIYWKDPKEPKRKISMVKLDIRISPTPDEAREKKSMQYSVEKSGFQFMSENNMAVIKSDGRGKNRTIFIRFYRKGFHVSMDLSGKINTNSSPSEDMAKHFARIVAAKIN